MTPPAGRASRPRGSAGRGATGWCRWARRALQRPSARPGAFGLRARTRRDHAGGDAALAVLELAGGTLAGQIEKDVCERVADSLRSAAFDTALRDRRFDRYFAAYCISAAARLAANVRDPRCAKDAVEGIHAALQQSQTGNPKASAAAVRLQAATRIRGAIPAP